MYGFQETCHVDEREEFYDELSTEVENCTIYGDNPIIAGDFNAKLDLQTSLTHLSANGKCLCEIVEKYSFEV